MKLFTVYPILWSSLLVVWASDTETDADSTDVCASDIDELSPVSSGDSNVEDNAVTGNFLCLYYSPNTLNCSWSFPKLQNESQLVGHISVCDGDWTVQSLNYLSEERVGSRSLILREPADTVFLEFNITLHNSWTVYTEGLDLQMIEVLSPPMNISASVKDGSLLVTWDLPHSPLNSNPSCFEYQLDLGDQKGTKDLTGLSYTLPNADPNYTYSVRMRSRKTNGCQKDSSWSHWSHTITVKQSGYKLNMLVIVSISLGIPMILLAVLLLVRHQRVSNVLFPPIPRPPPKYKCFLEKNDTFNFFYPTLSAEPEAEITKVEDTEQNPGKTS